MQSSALRGSEDSKLEARYDRAVSRQLDRAYRAGIAETRIQPSEASRSLTRTVPGLGRQCVGESGILHPGSIEDIAEFRPDIQSCALFDAESPPNGNVLYRTTLEAIVVIVCCRAPPLAGSGLSPRSGV